MNRLLVASAALMFSAPAMAAETKATCYYTPGDIAKEYRGPCTHSAKASGPETFTFTNGTKVVVEVVETLNGNARIKLNGKPGMRFIIDRTRAHAVTLDLKQVLEWDYP